VKRLNKAFSGSALALSLLTLATPVAHAAGAGNNAGGFDLSWLGWLGLFGLLGLRGRGNNRS
jgi:hypothetical protein